MPIKKHQRKSAIRNSVRKLCLSTSFLTILAAPALAQQGVLANGTDVTIPPDTVINTTPEFIAGAGVLVVNGGSIKTDGPVSIDTSGDGAAGVWVENNGSKAEIRQATITTTGSNSSFGGSAYGFLAKDGGAVSVSDTDVTTNGTYAVGVLAEDAGSSIDFKGGSITSTGDLGNASGEDPSQRYATVLARQGGQITMSAVEIANKGQINRGVGVLTQDGGSIISVNDSDINAAQGATARDGGHLTLTNTSVEARQQGIYAGGEAAEIDMTGGSINMTVSDFRGEAVLAANGGTASLTGVKVDTVNDSGHGALVMGDSTVNLTDTNINTSGVGADGVRVGWSADRFTGGTANVTGGKIVTTGEGADGLDVLGAGSLANVGASTVSTSGAHAHGVAATDGGAVSVSDTDVTTNGTYAVGVLAENAGSSIDYNGGKITSNGDLGNASGEDPSQRYATVLARQGGQITMSAVEIANKGQINRGVGVLAQDGGSIISVNDSDINAAQGATARDGGHLTLTNTSVEARQQGIYAGGEAAEIDMTGGSISMTVSDFRGEAVLAANGGTASLTGVKVDTVNDSGHGALVMGDSTVNLTDTNINTSGVGADGVRVGWSADRFTGGTANVTGGKIVTTGEGADGLDVLGAGSLAKVDGATIMTNGGGAHGAFSGDGGFVELDASKITTMGTEAAGAKSSGMGSVVTVAGGSVTTTGDNAWGLAATDGGTISSSDTTTENRLKIKTTGDNARGVWASNGGVIELANTDISTSGGYDPAVSNQWGARGVSAEDGGSVVLGNTTVSTRGQFAHGLYATGLAGASSTVKMANGTIQTSGPAAHGARALGSASIDLDNVNVSTIGTGSTGVSAANGGTASINGGQIATSGDKAAGIDALSGSTVTVDGTIIKTQGGGEGVSWSVGVLAGGASKVDLQNSTIETSGYRGEGINVFGDGSYVGMADGKITTTGANADGAVAFDGGTASLSNVAVSTFNGRGVVAGDAGSSLTMTGGSVTTKGSGDDQSAVFAVRGASINLTGVAVQTEGDDARGLHAFNAGSTINAMGVGVTTLGAGSHGVFASDSGVINITDSAIETKGADANAVQSFAGNAGTVNTITLKNSVLEANNGASIAVSGGVANIDFIDSKAVVNDGRWLNVRANEAGEAAVANVFIDPSEIRGAAITEAGSVSNVTLQESLWTMTGNSNLTNLAVNDSTILFDTANPYKALSVGTLSTYGGSFLLNTRLNEGGAASETDKIVVAGNADGNGSITIRNNGGTGAATGTGPSDGIQVVQIGGKSNADFKLAAPAIVGNYDYQLAKADGQNWYLQTAGEDPVPDNGGGDNGGGSDDGGHMADIIPGENIALAAAQQHVLTTLDTFHERVGELRSEEMEDGFHAWTRGIGKTGSYSPGISGYAGHGFDQTTGGFQIGGDYSVSDAVVVGDKLTFGVFGEYAHSNFDVSGRTAEGSIASKGLGGYVTWQQKAPTNEKPGTGAYVDAVIKHDWLDFDVRAKSVSGFDMENGYNGRALSASIETGYGFDLGNNVVLQPQAQLTWSKVDADSFTDPYGITIRDQQAESLTGRLGVRLEKTFYFGDNPQDAIGQVKPKAKGKKGHARPAVLPATPKKKKFIRSVTTFVDANARHEFKGENGLIANGDRIGSDMSGTRYDVGAGVVARVNKDLSLYARGAVEFGGSTNVAGKVSGGFKITW
ncbi:autotransporter outer membrane beta-barrel domain-containing protein [Brucella cytisi]|uniref:Autotransporter domain-containing protein n=1 Tax=Brucella cytisi TaxID=407152 RepID=A0A1J6HFB7_9HYPH|nr:autotransporter outer membrane beta-barrel domain-containing protein [Brucella cytisi]OIS91059.1 hypothetical protein BLA27_23435 [Brucella cytisi]